MYVPGTDGEKMSKSRGNEITIFLADKQLRKQVMRIETDSKGLDDIKDPDTCNIFALYKILASETDQLEMRRNYATAGYGYGHAKQALFELITEKYATQRERYNYLMEHPEEIESALKIGQEKARKVASEVLKRARSRAGY